MSDHDPFPTVPHEPAAPVIDHAPAEVRPPPPSAPPEPAARTRRRGGGGFAILVALVLFGAMEAQNYGYLKPYGVPPPGFAGDTDSAGLAQRVQDLSQDQARMQAQISAAQSAAQSGAQSGGQSGAQSGADQALTQQVQALSDRIDKLEKAPPASGAPAAPDLGDLPKRVDELAAKVAALESQPPPAAAPADNGADQQAIAALGQKLDQKLDQAQAETKAALAQQQSQVQDEINTAVQASAKQVLQQAQTAAQSTAQDAAQAAAQSAGKQVLQEAQVAAQATAQAAAQAAAQSSGKQVLQEAQAAALSQIQAVLVQEKTALDALGARISKLEQGADTVEDAASRATRLERVQAAVVALQSGQKLGNIPGAPPALARFADQAPPTEAALRESFPALAAHAREVSQPDTAHRSFFQRAFARLQESVTVRQGDDVLVGDPAAGVLADAEVKVQNGDLAGAVQRLSALHGPAAGVMQPWVEKAQSLLAARAALAGMAARG